MQQASGILQRIVHDAVAQSLKRLPADELPQAAWEFAAGRAVAEKTRVLGFEICGESHVLRVEVADVNWRSQLRDMAQQYLTRLRPLLAIERIEFELAGTAQPSQTTSATRGQMWATKKSTQSLPLQQKGTHEGHRKGRKLRRRPGES
jgi:Dna[CI] antecedent DciA-like protein